MPLQRLYELYQIASTPWAWHAPLIERAQALGLIAFSTPFDGGCPDSVLPRRHSANAPRPALDRLRRWQSPWPSKQTGQNVGIWSEFVGIDVC